MNPYVESANTAVLLLVLAGVWLWARRRDRQAAERRAQATPPVELVRIHLKAYEGPDGRVRSGETLEGYLVFRARDHYALERAKWLMAEDQTLVLEGVTEVQREDVFFVQRLAVDTSGDKPQETT